MVCDGSTLRNVGRHEESAEVLRAATEVHYAPQSALLALALHAGGHHD